MAIIDTVGNIIVDYKYDAWVISGTGLHAVRNAFAYCNNRAINYSDPNGKKPILSTSIVIVIKSIAQIATSAYREALGTWRRLTKTEKTLAVLKPKEAMIVKSRLETTDRIVRERFGDMDDGDKANAFRHALWNGFDAFQHREMDYHNNALCRSCVPWYEFWLSPDQIADQIMAKLDIGEGMILVE